MMKRICPYCKSELSESNMYFCTFCGKPLPENLQITDASFKSVKEVSSKTESDTSVDTSGIPRRKFSESFNLSGIAMGIAFGVILSLGFNLFFRLTTPSTATIVETTPKEEVVKRSENIEMTLDLKLGSFGQNKVHDYVPYDVDVYMEFNDSATLEPYFSFFGGEFFTLTENIKDDIKPFYAAFSMFKGIGRDWVLIVFPSKENINLGTPSTITTSMIDGALVISPDPALIDEVKLSKSGVSKNIGMHPALISIKPTIPLEGKVFILKTTKDGDRVLDDLVRKTFSDDLKSIVEKFKDLESNYLVIQ